MKAREALAAVHVVPEFAQVIVAAPFPAVGVSMIVRPTPAVVVAPVVTVMAAVVASIATALTRFFDTAEVGTSVDVLQPANVPVVW